MQIVWNKWTLNLLAGHKSKTQYDKREELFFFFEKAPLQALILYASDFTAF